MKKKTKKDDKNKNAEIKVILDKTNDEVLEYVDNIINEAEKQKIIRELITQLEITLLDRDAGRKGPKLIEQLQERLNNSNNSTKEYKLEDLIWWTGTEAQLEYLITNLIHKELIAKHQYHERFSLIAKHFRNEDGNRFKNKQVSQAVRNLRGEKPPHAEMIEDIAEDTKNQKVP